MNIDITYRGHLASCNYDCDYCPFAKTFDDAEAREKDKSALFKFVDWVESRSKQDELKILFTPWGEGLVRKWYREALKQLSHMPHVKKVAIQTNLSSPVDWLEHCKRDSIALWTTFHPSETTIERFTKNTRKLDKIGIAYSVGFVGKNEDKSLLKTLRQNLPESVYLWINAYKDIDNYYTSSDIDFFKTIDPHFELNLRDHASHLSPCKAACEAISIDGDGNVTPCHFVKHKLGNIYEDELYSLLKDKYLCPNSVCDCYVGYRHLSKLPIKEIYGDCSLERIAIKT